MAAWEPIFLSYALFDNRFRPFNFHFCTGVSIVPLTACPAAYLNRIDQWKLHKHCKNVPLTCEGTPQGSHEMTSVPFNSCNCLAPINPFSLQSSYWSLERKISFFPSFFFFSFFFICWQSFSYLCWTLAPFLVNMVIIIWVQFLPTATNF